MLLGNPKFDRFVEAMKSIIAAHRDDERQLIDAGSAELAALVATDDWLPSAFAEPDPATFRQYMLHRDPDLPFSILSVVWGPGQKAIAHDHRTWGIIGQLRGAERTNIYEKPTVPAPMRPVSTTTLHPGDTAFVSPALGDIHDVENVAGAVSVSIHVYGGDLEALLGERRRYRIETGEAIAFETSYH